MESNKAVIVKILRSVARNFFLLVNSVFALFYIFGVIATKISPLWTTFFAYFGLLFPFIVSVNICFIIFWIIRKRRYWLMSAVLLALTYSHVNNFFTIPYTVITGHKPLDKEIKLLSYNISSLGSVRDFDQFMGFIDSIDADIVCFQEFGYYVHHKDRLKKAMEKNYPYSHIWYKNQSRNYSWGVATFSKHPVINKKKIEYSSRYNVSIYSDIDIGDDTIRVINNHLESNKFTLADIRQYRTLDNDLSGNNILNTSSLFSRKLGEAYKIRATQAAMVKAAIDSSPYKSVVCGDFNDVTESYAYSKIKDGLTDLFTATAWGYRYSFRSNYMLVGIDHILIDHRLIPLSRTIDRKNYSDHYPLIGIFGTIQTK